MIWHNDTNKLDYAKFKVQKRQASSLQFKKIEWIAWSKKMIVAQRMYAFCYFAKFGNIFDCQRMFIHNIGSVLQPTSLIQLQLIYCAHELDCCHSFFGMRAK